MVTGLGTLICQVSSVEETAAFYHDVLKLKPSYVSPHWGRIDLPGGGSIGLHPPFENGKKPDGSGWILGIEVESITAIKIALELAGPWTGPFHEVPSGVVMDFFDPNGNPLQAMQKDITLQDLN